MTVKTPAARWLELRSHNVRSRTGTPLVAEALAPSAAVYVMDLLAARGFEHLAEPMDLNERIYSSPTALLRTFDPAQPLVGSVVDTFDIDGVMDLLWHYAEAYGRIRYSNEFRRNGGNAGTDEDTGAWDIKLSESSEELRYSKAWRARTIAHEIGHTLFNHQWDLRRNGSYKRAEFEAEMFAYVMLQSLGIGGQRLSITYLRRIGWPRDGASFGDANFAAAYGLALAARDDAIRIYPD